MPAYHRLGELPRKRHTAFRQPDGSLYHEHVMGSRGFSGPASLLYHRRPPTSVVSTTLLQKCDWEAEAQTLLHMRHFQLHRLPAVGSPSLARVPLLYNSSVALSFVQPPSN